VVVVMIAVGVFLLDPFERAPFNPDLRFNLKLLLDFLNCFLSLKGKLLWQKQACF
jgi:hypothetical protein